MILRDLNIVTKNKQCQLEGIILNSQKSHWRGRGSQYKDLGQTWMETGRLNCDPWNQAWRRQQLFVEARATSTSLDKAPVRRWKRHNLMGITKCGGQQDLTLPTIRREPLDALSMMVWEIKSEKDTHEYELGNIISGGMSKQYLLPFIERGKNLGHVDTARLK